MVIIPVPCLYDSREQLPLSPCLPRSGERLPIVARRVTLESGDYGIEGLTLWRPMDEEGPWRGAPMVAIERKSIQDLWGTLFGVQTDALGEAAENKARFRDELIRLRAYAFARVVIEGSQATLLEYARARSVKGGRRFPEANVASVLELLASFEVDYGIGVVWAGGRMGAEAYVGRVLNRIWMQHSREAKAVRKARERGLSLPWMKGAEA